MTDLVCVGEIVRPQGIRGEVRMRLLTDFPERLSRLREVWVTLGNESPRSLVLERVRWQGRTPILKFRDIDSREDAHRLAHAVVQIARAVIPPLPPGKFYLFEIIGLEVITDGGRPVGRIRDVLLLPANDVYVIDAPEGEILIPATREIVRDVDISRKKVVIHPLPGLLEPQP